MCGAGKRFAILVLAASALSLLVTELEAAPADKIIAIRAGKLVDVVTGDTLIDQVIIVEGDRIKSLGAVATTPVPESVEIIALAHTTVPGVIDAPTYLTSDPTQHGSRSLAISGVRSALYDVRAARLTLEAGFTSVRNVGALSPGKFADLIAVDEDPGQDATRLTKVRFGMKGGKVVKSLTP